MRPLHVIAVAAVLGPASVTVDSSSANEFCSVFSRKLCTPTFCSVYQRRPCLPHYEHWVGQDLRLTIESKSTTAEHASPDVDREDRQLHSLRDIFATLRSCWRPPPEDEAREGMQMSVRFAFTRSGEVIAEPRVTYTTPEASSSARAVYRRAIAAALERCTPLPFSSSLGGAVAGRPIAIRFVDNRPLGQKDQP